MMLTVHPLTPERIAPCMLSLRPADAEELSAAGIEDAITMLAEAVPDCLWADEARWNDAPIAVFGVRAMPGGEVGVPWMLATTELDNASRAAVARAAVRAVARMRRDFHTLTNIVHAANADAIRFVEWLGFHVEQDLTGPGYAFRQFHWSRPCATP
jgi:RimJ/RimL family protein N-acetyltransferase